MEDVPYGRILREGWVVIVVLAVFGAGMGWLVTKMLPETYAATSTPVSYTHLTLPTIYSV